jgi:hypothetical protein
MTTIMNKPMPSNQKFDGNRFVVILAPPLGLLEMLLRNIMLRPDTISQTDQTNR